MPNVFNLQGYSNLRFSGIQSGTTNSQAYADEEIIYEVPADKRAKVLFRFHGAQAGSGVAPSVYTAFHKDSSVVEGNVSSYSRLYRFFPSINASGVFRQCKISCFKGRIL